MTEYARMLKELRAAGHDVGASKPRAKTVRQIVRDEIKRYEAVMIKAVGQALGEAMREIEQKIEKLEGERLKHVGHWEPGQAYKRGSVVTAGGSAFTAIYDTDTKPGTSAAWSLLAARGRDGRDGRDAEPRTVKSSRGDSSHPPSSPQRSNGA